MNDSHGLHGAIKHEMASLDICLFTTAYEFIRDDFIIDLWRGEFLQPRFSILLVPLFGAF